MYRPSKKAQQMRGQHLCYSCIFLRDTKYFYKSFWGRYYGFFFHKFNWFSCRLSQSPSLLPLQDAVQLNADGKVWFASWLVADNLFDKEALLNDHIYEFS